MFPTALWLDARAALCKGLLCVGLFSSLFFTGCSRSSGSSSRAVDVRLNEVMARNATVTVPDLDGRLIAQDWVEIYNAGSTSANLGGFSLSDNPDRPRKFVFSNGTIVGPGEFLIVFLINEESCLAECSLDRAACRAQAGDVVAELVPCDAAFDECVAQCTPSGLVADFGLSAGASGESVFLFDPARSVVDRIGIQSPPPDVSGGRFPDADDEVGIMYLPTPGETNKPVGVRAARFSTTAPSGGGGLTDTQPLVLTIVVERDQVASDAAQQAKGSMVIRVEYADLEPGSPCPPSDEDLAHIGLLEADVQLIGVDEAIDSSRQDVLGQPTETPIFQLTYEAILPPAPCATVRYHQTTVEDDLGGFDVRVGCATSCLDPVVLVSEYQPQNTQFVFDSVNADGEPRPRSTPDWLELHNVSSEPIPNIGQYILVGRGGCRDMNFDPARNTLDALRGVEGDEGPVPLPPLEPGDFLWILADDDGGGGRRTYALVGDPESRTFFSTRFRLSPNPNDDGFDAFCLFSPQLVLIDDVVLDFTGQDVDFARDRSVGRFPEIEGDVAGALKPGTVTDCPTPERDNLMVCENVPSFFEVVTTEAETGGRCPEPLTPVVVRAQVNFDNDTEFEDLRVDLFATASGVEIGGVDLVLSLSDDQSQAAPAKTLYDVEATIPGQEAGALVEFFFEAEDLRLAGFSPLQSAEFNLEEQPVVHDQTTAPEVSFRYLVGFEPAADAPRISEVLPRNESVVLPPFENLPPGVDQSFPDFAEVFNPSAQDIDLDGYYLTGEVTQGDPIRRARRWRFPPNSIVPAGGYLAVYFGPPPALPEPLVPPEYVQVTGFDLACEREALFLIAPDAPELGGNCVVDSMGWRLVTSLGCKDDVSVGTLCEGDTEVAEFTTPTPGAPNLLPTLLYDSYHEISFQPGRNGCLEELVGSAEVITIAFVDAGVVDALESDSLIDPTYVFDRGRGEERQAAQVSTPASVCSNPADPSAPCVEVPDGYRIVRLGLLMSAATDTIRYRVEFADNCGVEFDAGPFSVGLTTGPHPELFLNEVNRSFPVGTATTIGPWVELFNPSAESVDATGMFLSDNSFNPRHAVLVDGPILPPRGFAVVFLNELDASFDLEVPGTLFLSDSQERGTCTLDSLSFDFTGADEDVSFGRSPDASDNVVLLSSATPGRPNDDFTFVRGDATEDLVVNVLDMVRALSILFESDATLPRCLDSVDANDDGRLTIADVGFIGSATFGRGPPIPPPFPSPGVDPTPDDLSCGSSGL